MLIESTADLEESMKYDKMDSNMIEYDSLWLRGKWFINSDVFIQVFLRWDYLASIKSDITFCLNWVLFPLSFIHKGSHPN